MGMGSEVELKISRLITPEILFLNRHHPLADNKYCLYMERIFFFFCTMISRYLRKNNICARIVNIVINVFINVLPAKSYWCFSRSESKYLRYAERYNKPLFYNFQTCVIIFRTIWFFFSHSQVHGVCYLQLILIFWKGLSIYFKRYELFCYPRKPKMKIWVLAIYYWYSCVVREDATARLMEDSFKKEAIKILWSFLWYSHIKLS